MKNRIVLVYKSRTGFTKKYAEMIAEEINCTLLNAKDMTAEAISDFDVVVFGSRCHAGKIDGIEKAKKLFRQSKAKKFAIFATGATPNAAEELIHEMWNHNLSPFELHDIPHFYMQSGLCYEKMSLPEKAMMKVFYAMMKNKKDKNVYEIGFEQAISNSYDISSKDYIHPLVNYLKAENTSSIN